MVKSLLAQSLQVMTGWMIFSPKWILTWPERHFWLDHRGVPVRCVQGHNPAASSATPCDVWRHILYHKLNCLTMPSFLWRHITLELILVPALRWESSVGKLENPFPVWLWWWWCWLFIIISELLTGISSSHSLTPRHNLHVKIRRNAVLKDLLKL